MPPHGRPPGGKPFPNRDDSERGKNTAGGELEIPALRPSHPAGHEEIPMPLLLDFVIAALMLGFDLAIAFFFRYQEEQEKARRLEAAHLQHELEHLKTQINPHFFMNILNNIHGMIEIAPAKAQVMIMELSGLMRYTSHPAVQGDGFHRRLRRTDAQALFQPEGAHQPRTARGKPGAYPPSAPAVHQHH